MPDVVRIRVSIGNATLELEGAPDWVAQYDDDLKKMLDRVSATSLLPLPGASVPESPSGPASTSIRGDEDFGEVLQTLPKGSSATDQMLLAGWFAQQSKPDNAFATRDASALLLEQGVKVGNPSQCMTNNLKAKRVFKVSGGGYRVARAGTEYLSELQGR